jgi:MIP family channel proteins
VDRVMRAQLLAEGIGTFLFVFVGAGSIVVMDYQAGNQSTGAGLLGVALAHGLALAVLVSAFGAISGGQFNPAVTFGVWIAGRIDGARAVGYVLAQLVGAVVAGLVLRGIFVESVWKASSIGTPALGPGVGLTTGIVVEAILTLILLLAVFGTAVDPRAPKIGGLAIGLAVAADILVGGPLTGAAMNTARWFGPAVASGHLDNAIVWIVGPLLGAAAAAAVYRWVFAKEVDLGRTPGTPEP